MTTAKQVKELLAPFLALHPDLILSGRWVFVPPVNHVAAYILIDRTSDPDLFMVRWGGSHLFAPQPGIDLVFGAFAYSTRRWLLSEPATQDDLTRKLDAIVPTLRTVRTIKGYWDFANGPHMGYDKLGGFPLRAVLVQIAMGDLSRARELYDEMERGETEWGRRGRAFFLRDEAMRMIVPLLKADDRAGLAELLHGWERASGVLLPLRGIWQPSPFPFETALT